MIELHQPLRRNRGLPYITHPLEVMSAARSMPEKILALVHDYGELRAPEELVGFGIPTEMIDKVRLLAKDFPADVPEMDPRYCKYVWNLLGDPMCRRVKYFDLATNDGFEEVPDAAAPACGKYPGVMQLLADAAYGRLYFKSKSLYVNLFSNFYPVELVIDGEKWKSAEHFYQAAKFSRHYGFCRKPAVYEAIRDAEHAGIAKQIADENFNEPDRETWDRTPLKLAVTAMMLTAKFAPGTDAWTSLRKTGDLELVHGSFIRRRLSAEY